MACWQTDRYSLIGWKTDDACSEQRPCKNKAFEGEGDKMQGTV